jgi:hypothetical protein
MRMVCLPFSAARQLPDPSPVPKAAQMKVAAHQFQSAVGSELLMTELYGKTGRHLHFRHRP